MQHAGHIDRPQFLGGGTSMHKTVMVVDDNETDLLLTRLTLERSGIAGRLVLMRSAVDALVHLAGPGPAINLILLDVNMPGMDGFEFLDRHAQGAAPPVPVVMLSASPDPADRARALAHAFVLDFLSKPLDLAKTAGLRAHLPD